MSVQDLFRVRLDVPSVTEDRNRLWMTCYPPVVHTSHILTHVHCFSKVKLTVCVRLAL